MNKPANFNEPLAPAPINPTSRLIKRGFDVALSLILLLVLLTPGPVTFGQFRPERLLATALL